MVYLTGLQDLVELDAAVKAIERSAQNLGDPTCQKALTDGVQSHA